MAIEETPKTFDYVPLPFSNNFGHYPFPEEGDVIWVGDDMGTVIKKEFDPSVKFKQDGDSVYTRYMEIKLLVTV